MKLTQSLVAIAALSTLASTLSFAGGDINPVTVFEQEAVVVPVTPVPVPTAPKAPEAPTPPPVVAAPLGLYIAGGITDVAVNSAGKANFFSDKVGQDRQIGLTGRFGYDFMDYLGAELRGTAGVSKASPTKFKQIGAYLKPNYDLTDELNLYGLVGASKTNGAGTGTNTGLSYGAGLDYGISDSVSVFTDVVNYMKKSNTSSQWGLTLGAAYAF
jgi:opacity protein-like surface antigen